MNKAKNKSAGKAKGGAMVGRIIWEFVKFCITAFIITNLVNIILMGPLLPRFEQVFHLPLCCVIAEFRLAAKRPLRKFLFR